IRGNKVCEYLENAPFAIHILAEVRADVALKFAVVSMKQEVQWRDNNSVPVLEGQASTLKFKLWRIYVVGDHLYVIGAVTHIKVNDVEPLLFVSGKFRHTGRFVQGTPWEGSGDSLSFGWFEEPNIFTSF